MTTAITLISILISFLGLAYMTATDPKRRRGAKLQQYATRPLLWPARIALFGPGVVLIAVGHWAGLCLWGGAITVIGWGIAAITPANYGRFHAYMQKHLARIGDVTESKAQTVTTHVQMAFSKVELPTTVQARLSSLREKVKKPPTSTEDKRLEARIIALEARLHRLERENEELRQGVVPDPLESLDVPSKAKRS